MRGIISPSAPSLLDSELDDELSSFEELTVESILLELATTDDDELAELLISTSIDEEVLFLGSAMQALNASTDVNDKTGFQR